MREDYEITKTLTRSKQVVEKHQDDIDKKLILSKIEDENRVMRQIKEENAKLSLQIRKEQSSIISSSNAHLREPMGQSRVSHKALQAQSDLMDRRSEFRSIGRE